MKEDIARQNSQKAEELCEKINEDAAREVSQILQNAQNQARSILEEARRESLNERLNLLKDFDKESQLLKSKIFSTVNFEKKKFLLNEKNKFIESVLSAVKKSSESFRKDNGYPGFLKNAVLEGLGIIDAQVTIVIYSYHDAKIFTEPFIKEIEDTFYSLRNKLVSLSCKQGNFNDIGVIVQSEDGHLNYDNRFFARYGRMYEDIYISLLRENR